MMRDLVDEYPGDGHFEAPKPSPHICNLCGISTSAPGYGGTTVGIDTATNRMTVSHTRCRDMYTKGQKPIHVDSNVHTSEQSTHD